MLWILTAMLLIVALAAVVAAYVAYPRRGFDVPGLPWLGPALQRAVDALPTLDDPSLQDRPSR